MVTAKMKEFVSSIEELYRDGQYSLQKHRKLRESLYEFMLEEIQGLEVDEDFQFVSILGEKAGDLINATNILIKESEPTKRYAFLNKFVAQAKKTKLKKIQPYQKVVNEVAFVKAQVKDKIKILIEENELYIFFEDDKLLEKYEEQLIGCLRSSLSFINPKKIESIGMIKGNIIFESIHQVASCMKAVLGDNLRDLTIVSENEILIYLNSNKD